MGKINTSTIVGIILTILCLFVSPAQAKYNGGTGDPCDPYQINDPCQLNAVGLDPCDWDKHFILTADIDLSAYTGTQFNIIGRFVDNYDPENKPFRGIFDGNGHTIFDFTYITSNSKGIGLFGYVDNSSAVIKDLCLSDPCVIAVASDYVGSLVGKLKEGNIETCFVKFCRVCGNSRVGGLVGGNHGKITNCYTECSVVGTEKYVGGLVGYNFNGTISNCYSTGWVSGGNYVGGLLGRNEVCNGRIANISYCYATGNVVGNDYIGGLLGFNRGYYGTADIFCCHASSYVSGDNYIGGLLGMNFASTINGGYANISRCYSTGNVIGKSAVGGLVGKTSGDKNHATIFANYATSYTHGTGDFIGGLVGLNYTFISNCYALGSVVGNGNVGGLVGRHYEDDISACYSAGKVEGNGRVGGLVGYSFQGTVNHSFWNILTSGQTSSAGGTGKTTNQMQTKSTFMTAGWDFVGESANGTEDIWRMCVDSIDYPKLS